MKQVTLYQNNSGECKFVEWKQRGKPTNTELTPQGAEVITYMLLPSDMIERLTHMTNKEVHNIIKDYLP